jgi:hypothetical protein
MGVDYREQYRPEHLEPFFPNEIIKLSIVVLSTLAVIVFLVILPVLLENLGVGGIFHEEQPADPETTPPHIKPEWYFLAVYQYLKLMPQDIMGIDGKGLGVLTQGIGILLVLLLPFWFPLKPANLVAKEWGRGLLTFCGGAAMFAVTALVFERIRVKLPEGSRDILHPLFVWPPAAVGSLAVAGLIDRRLGHAGAFGWLKLFVTGSILVGFQFVACIIVLGQGLSWGLASNAGYVIGAIPCALMATGIVIFVVLRARGRDEGIRWKALAIFVTEAIVVWVGLTLWALWPPEGLLTEKGWTAEAKGFGFSLLMIAAALIVFFSLVITERVSIRRTLGPPEQRRRML